MYAHHSSTLIVLAAALLSVGCTAGEGASAATADASAQPEQELGLTQLAVAPAVRRIASGLPEGFDARPAPDGRSISRTTYSMEALTLHDVASGSKIELQFRHPTDTTAGAPNSSSISPNGKSIAYGWRVSKTNLWELRVGTISGPDSGMTRTILALPTLAVVDVQAWTPDGSEVIAMLTYQKDGDGVAAVSVTGGAVRLLKDSKIGYPMNVSSSRDGRWLAFDDRSDKGDRDVYVMAADGTNTNLVLQHSGEDVVLGWANEPGRLLVLSERTGTTAMWSIAIENGKASGEPVLVRADMWKSGPIGTSIDGRVFYSVTTGERNVYTVSLDPQSAMVTSKPVAMSKEVDIRTDAFGWSNDGKHLALFTMPGSSVKEGEYTDVIIRSMQGEQLRRLTVALVSVFRAEWYPDGRSLLLHALNQQRKLGVYRVELASGEQTILHELMAGGRVMGRMRFTPDGKRLLFVDRDSTATNVNEMDPQRGTVTRLWRLENTAISGAFSISPDSRTLALTAVGDGGSNQRLVQVSLEDGAQRDLLTLPSSEQFSSAGIAWSADGRHILFGVRSPSGVDRHEVRTLSVADGRVKPAGLTERALHGLVISRDGRTLTYGADDLEGELWMMEAPVTTRASSSGVRR